MKLGEHHGDQNCKTSPIFELFEAKFGMIGTIWSVNIYDVAIFFIFTEALLGILDHSHK